MTRPRGAWRQLDGGRRLRRPAGEQEVLDELPTDLGVGVLLEGLDLAGERREPLTLVDSVLRRCDLAGGSWQQVTVRQVEVVDCRATGLRLSVDLAQDTWVSGCRFDAAVVHVERVRGLLAFVGCTFADALLTGDLSQAVFDDCDFDGAEFALSAATGCDLRTSRLAAARGLLTLRGARVTADQAVGMGPRLAAEAGLAVED